MYVAMAACHFGLNRTNKQPTNETETFDIVVPHRGKLRGFAAAATGRPGGNIDQPLEFQ
jgi:hypothetical protein